MSDPRKEQQERDELDLEAETVKDLDVDESGAANVAGGQSSHSTLYVSTAHQG